MNHSLPATLLIAGQVAVPLAAHAVPAQITPEVVAAAVKGADRRHPRLFADAAGFAALRDQTLKTPLGEAAAGRLLFEADRMLSFPVNTRTLEGRRLLGVSRSVLHRTTTLAMAFRLTGNRAYLERAAAEMRAAAGFADWNPSHFLDVAEMTLGLAIGYDWLHAELDRETRQIVAEAILKKGLLTSLETTGWVGARNNWGQVCHAGMLAGAFALLEDHEALAAEIAHRAIVNLPGPMEAFAPDGCYPEGPVYWSYGTGFNVIAIALLESVLRTDYGLSGLPGFAATADYLDRVTGPSGKTFNYADGGMGRGTDCATWWFASRFNRPDILVYFEREAFLRLCADRKPFGPAAGGHRLFPLTLFWLRPVGDERAPRTSLNWSSGGAVPITVQRTSWDNAQALFAGLKAGSPAAPHGHMDAGSFVLDADGVRWAYDLGAENYHGIEQRGMNLWGRAQDSDRWKIFRLGSHSHNTLVIDGELQWAQGKAAVTSFRDGPESEAVLDLSPVYPSASQVIRTGTLLASGEYRLADTLRGLRPGARVRWTLMTRAEPDVARTGSLLLREAGRQLRLTAEHDAATVWQVDDAAQPRNEWDSPNPGMRQIGFEAAAPASGELDLAVRFTPGGTAAPP